MTSVQWEWLRLDPTSNDSSLSAAEELLDSEGESSLENLLEQLRDSEQEDEERDTMADVGEMTMEQMRAELVRRREEEAAAPARGGGGAVGGREVLFKNDPPSLDDHVDYKMYKRELQVWKSSLGNVSDKQKAAALIMTITDKHKIKKGLKTLLLNTLTDAQLANPSVAAVEKFLDEQLKVDEEEQLYYAYLDFEYIKIQPNERYQDYTVRFDTLYKALSVLSGDIKIPDKILAMKLRCTACLDRQTIMNVRAEVKWNEANVYENTKKAINRICLDQTPSYPKVAQIKLVHGDTVDNVDVDSAGLYYINGKEMMFVEDHHQCLMAGADKGKGDKKGTSSRGRGRDTGATRRFVRTCHNCGEEGHFVKDCPHPKQRRERRLQENHNITGSYDEDERDSFGGWAQSYCTEAQGEDIEAGTFNNCWGENVREVSEDDEAGECFVSKKLVGSFTDEAEGAAGLDTCCSRTVMGKRWFERYKELVPADMKKHIKGPHKTNMNFLFGDGESLDSLGRYDLPVQLHSHKAMLSVEMVSSDIPLLLSKSTMVKCGTVIDMGNMTVAFFGDKRTLKETSMGHPVVSVIPVTYEPFQSEVLIVGLERAEQEINLTRMKTFKQQVTEREQREIINKVHKQTGHQGKKKLKQFLEQSSIQWSKGLVDKELNRIRENCRGCIIKRNTPAKPVACIPVADGFNKCVAFDLRIEPGGEGIILYCMDMWSRLIQAVHVPSKRGEDIVAGILDIWVSKYGCFEKTIHDNGGEFVSKSFVEMCDMLGVHDGTTAAHSPWSAGMVEKNHALVDRTLESLMEDFPTYSKRTLLNWAVAIKNSTVNGTGFSPFQVVFGRNPKLPCILTNDIAAMREEVVSNELMVNLNVLDRTRVRFNEAIADNAVKRMLRAKVRKNQTVFQPGDMVFWRATNDISKWLKGKVLTVDGSVMWVRRGSNIRRVSTDMAVKVNEEFDKDGKLVDVERVETEAEERVSTRRGRKQKFSFDFWWDENKDQNGEDTEAPGLAREDDQRQPPAQSEAPEVEAAAPGTGSEVQEEAAESGQDGDHSQDADRSVDDNNEGREEETEVFEAPDCNQETSAKKTVTFAPEVETEVTRSSQVAAGVQDMEIDVPISKEDVRIMQRTEAEEVRRVGRPKKRKSEHQESGTPAKAKKGKIELKKGDKIILGDKEMEVVGRAGKATGKNRNFFNLQELGKKMVQMDLTDSVFQKNSQSDCMLMNGEQQECLMEIVPWHLHGNQDCVAAKKEEIKKIVEDYKAVEVVKDEGQFRISCRYVLWYKKHSDGSVQTRARLVARGYEETDSVPSDSPTMDQINLKVLLALSQSQRDMEAVTIDIKSAFLQGLPLHDRDVFVKAPPEAGLPPGHLWKLRICLYGLSDASLRFHQKVKLVMKQLGLRQSKLDPAVFYELSEDGQMKGVIGTHVDDFLLVGNREWWQGMRDKISKNFELGKVEEKNFLYCGYRIIQETDGMMMDQQEYADNIKPLIIPPGRRGQDQDKVTDYERKQIRAWAGKLGWLGRGTRPDILFSQIEASSSVTTATVSDLKKLSKAVTRISQSKSVLRVPKLPEKISEWQINLHTDAAWQNIGAAGSTGGRVILLSGGGYSFPVFWGAHRLRRVCNSSQSAEILSMNEGIGEADYVKQFIQEITGVELDVDLTIDCKNAYGAVTSNTAPQVKAVRCQAQSVREALQLGEVKRIKLVTGKQQLADPLTKRGADSDRLLQLVQTGKDRQLGQ